MSVARITLAGVQIEGNLLAADITAELLASNVKGQAPEDFGFTKTDKLADEIAIAWGDAKAYWAAFQRQLDRLDADEAATSVTRELWAVPLLRSLGYNPVYTAKAEIVEGQTYAISHRAELGENKPPIHIIGCRIKVDHRPPSGTPRLSAHALVQEYLNKTEHLWAIATNGFRWRLLRDSSLMTRLTYIEFDLEQILNGENFAEFWLFYRLFHCSRLPEGMDDADKCLLEFYHQEALQQGGRVRDRLRDGVEKALIQLGTGFLQHPQNEHLRQKFFDNYELVYYRQLLRLIYRLLFLMVAESRNLLIIGDDIEKARIYQEYYSIERLRELAERPRWRREGFQDLWQGLRVTFLLFDENWRGQYLGLSPLNGDLFGSTTLPDLDDCAIDNHDLLVAIRELSLYQEKGQLRRVNYAALDVEELGSVYESLLDFHPEVTPKNHEFKLVFGSDRKTTGSYYTPPQLVGQLIKTALEPVIEEKVRSCASAHLDSDALKRNYEQSIQNIVDAANKLAEEKHFFHWCLEFPEVFEQGGFDCVMGNPPWELLQIAEKEFFASRSAEIVNAANKAAREKLISELPKKNPELGQEFEEAKHDADAQNKFIRESGRFPLTAVGKINTYAVFAETTRKLISLDGRVGVIVPTGIATDDTNKQFFADLTSTSQLASLYDFENREHLFSALHTKTKFCLLTLSISSNSQSSFAFMSTNLNNLKDDRRVFSLATRAINLFNPNTGNCPIFRSRVDAELTKKIYQHVPVLENENTGINPWGISFMQGLFNMSTDSGLFRNEAGNDLVPLYEAKMFYHFEHRWATYYAGKIQNFSDNNKTNVNDFIQPRYWVNKLDLENRLVNKWDRNWLLSVRNVTDSRNERSGVFSIIPKVGLGHSASIITFGIKKYLQFHACLLI